MVAFRCEVPLEILMKDSIKVGIASAEVTVIVEFVFKEVRIKRVINNHISQFILINR